MLRLMQCLFCGWLFFQIPLLDAMLESSNRIINSVYASRFISLASVHLLDDTQPFDICTGTIIHRIYVLTSATCLQNVKKHNRNFKGFVRVGTLNLSNSGQRYNFNTIIPHPLYDETQRRHDLALVHMSSPIVFNADVQPLEINYKYIRGGKRVYAAGWGPYDSHTSGFSEQLRWVADETSNVFQCVDKIRFTGQSVAQLHWDETLCIKNLPRGGMCRSDYGAPLIFNRTLVGVFSWGPENCTTESKFPYVFTRTSFYRLFFKKYLNPT